MSLLEALGSFIERNSDALSVEYGRPMQDAEVVAALDGLGASMPSSMRAVLAHYGYLEIEVASSLWPHSTYNDGLRFFGFGDAVPARLSLAEQARTYRAFVQDTKSRATESGDEPQLNGSNFEKMELRVPVLSTLEGIAQSWCSDTESLAWFRDYAHFSMRHGVLPKDSPLFEKADPEEVIAILLRRLQYRIERARLLSEVMRLLSTHGTVRVRGDQHLICDTFPQVQWWVWPVDEQPTLRATRRIGFEHIPRAERVELEHGVVAVRGYPEGSKGKPPLLVSLGLAAASPLDAGVFRDIAAALECAASKLVGASAAVAPKSDLSRHALPAKHLATAPGSTDWVAKS